MAAQPRRPVVLDKTLPAPDPSAPNRIELVLPLKPSNDERGSDIARVRGGLIASLNRFCDPDFVCLTIVVPRADIAQAEALADFCDIPLRVIAEEDLLPSLPPPMPRQGWYIQQMLKMAYATLCATPYYLTLDADCFLVDMLDERILVHGRAPAHMEPIAAHPKWWIASARILKATHSALESPDPVLGVTPAFLHAATMRGVIARLSDLGASAEQDWVAYLATHTTGDDDTWTEYALYWTHLINQADPNDLHYARQTYVFCSAVWQAVSKLRPDWKQETLFGILQSSDVSAAHHVRFTSRLLAQSQAPDTRQAQGLHGGYRYIDPTAFEALLAAGPPLLWPVSFGGVGANAVAETLNIKRGWPLYELISRFPHPVPLRGLSGFRALYLFDEPVSAIIRQMAYHDRISISRNNNINFPPARFESCTLRDYVDSGQDLLNLVDHFDNWTDPAGPLSQANYPVLMLRVSTIGRHLRWLLAFLGRPDEGHLMLQDSFRPSPVAGSDAETEALIPCLQHMYAALAARIDAFPDAALWDHRTGRLQPLPPD